jgi:hypothetical protein
MCVSADVPLISRARLHFSRASSSGGADRYRRHCSPERFKTRNMNFRGIPWRMRSFDEERNKSKHKPGMPKVKLCLRLATRWRRILG